VLSELLNHVDSGTGRPSVVFVHGLACALEDWEGQSAALSDRYRCIAVDLPGHGASPANGALSISRFGAELVSTLTALQATPAVLVGHSMGCRVVLDAARRLGDAVVGVVLVDGSVRGTGDPQVARDETRAVIEQAGFAPYIERLFRVMFVNDDDPALRERVVQRALRLDASDGTDLISDLAAWDAGQMAGALAAQVAPILVIQSSGVSADRRRIALKPGDSTPFVDRITAALPNTEVEIITDIGHFTMHEAATRVNELIGGFCQRLGVSADV
jgi:pimeloyl-ACP methyl ester carboxylesterase